ncbi:MAG TPA: hypothetical protein PLB11_15860, partial [Flavobacterium sp.]|nr:hypothetical protein [Flavobacterium sp.]
AQDLVFYQNNYDLPGAKEITGFDSFVNKVFTGDSQNKNGFDPKVDDEVIRNTFGRVFSFSMTYNF